MKKNILVLALSIVSFGAFAQGLGDLKDAAKNVNVEDAKEAVKTVVEEKSDGSSTNKVDELKGEAAEAINVDASTVDAVTDAVTEVAGDAVKNVATEKVAKIKEATETKLADMKAKRAERLANESKDPEKLEAYNNELNAELEEKEALKGEKRTALLAKITALGSKIVEAESKLGLLEKSGISPTELLQKTTILNGAKDKLAALTSSYN